MGQRPPASSDAVRKVMEANRSRDTEPEMRVRRILHGRGLRYRVAVRPIGSLNRRADIVFRTESIAVFIHGCFWHGCPEHLRPPKTNQEFWQTKIAATRVRDRETSRLLEASGWQCLVFWEHEDPCRVANEIEAEVREFHLGEARLR